MKSPTKKELEALLTEAREKIEVLEESIPPSMFLLGIIQKKGNYAIRATSIFFPVVLAIQTFFSALGKPSPFTGPFAWWLFALCSLYSIAYLFNITILLGMRARIMAELSEKKARIDMALGEIDNKSLGTTPESTGTPAVADPAEPG